MVNNSIFKILHYSLLKWSSNHCIALNTCRGEWGRLDLLVRWTPGWTTLDIFVMQLAKQLRPVLIHCKGLTRVSSADTPYSHSGRSCLFKSWGGACWISMVGAFCNIIGLMIQSDVLVWNIMGAGVQTLLHNYDPYLK